MVAIGTAGLAKLNIDATIFIGEGTMTYDTQISQYSKDERVKE